MSGDMVSSEAETAQSRMQGLVFFPKTYQVPGSSLVSVKARQGEVAACQGVKALSPDTFGATLVPELLQVLYIRDSYPNPPNKNLRVLYARDTIPGVRVCPLKKNGYRYGYGYNLRVPTWNFCEFRKTSVPDHSVSFSRPPYPYLEVL